VIAILDKRDGRWFAHLAVPASVGAAIAAAIWWNGRRTVTALRQLSAPLVVPIDDPLERVSALGEGHPAAPQLAGGRLIVPVENAGRGPAINVQGNLTLTSSAPTEPENASIGVLAPARRAALVFGSHASLGDFDLELTFEGPSSRVRRVKASWSHTERAYSISL
jgi:hypothetical protein